MTFKLYLIFFLHQTTTSTFVNQIVFILYLIFFLHQTTTTIIFGKMRLRLYLIFFLHQTTTPLHRNQKSNRLYLIFFLHQTTTHTFSFLDVPNCILSSFYIKPQLDATHAISLTIVSYLLSTSNHNSAMPFFAYQKLYLIFFLHQTTTWKI